MLGLISLRFSWPFPHDYNMADTNSGITSSLKQKEVSWGIKEGTYLGNLHLQLIDQNNVL